MGLTVVTIGDVMPIAKEFGICPYELELSYSELCDVVICDINYLFDPRSYIRRFFEDGGKVFSSVAAECPGYIFPDHVSGPNKLICSST